MIVRVLIIIARDIYLSTPRFINYLTDISSDLISSDNKDTILQKELTKLNKKLPGNVYIPFVSNQTRNYIVLSIPPSEAKVFVTKDKAPYLIAIEIFDPLEIAYDPIIDTISIRSNPIIPPAPNCLITEKEKKSSEKKSSYKMQRSSKDLTYKEIEQILNIHFNPKLQDRNHKEDKPITIQKASSKNTIQGLILVIISC